MLGYFRRGNRKRFVKNSTRRSIEILRFMRGKGKILIVSGSTDPCQTCIIIQTRVEDVLPL